MFSLGPPLGFILSLSLNKGKYDHFLFLFFWEGNRLSYLSNRNWQAVRKMSTMPSFFSCLQQTLVAIKQPVLPMPALRNGRAEEMSEGFWNFIVKQLPLNQHRPHYPFCPSDLCHWVLSDGKPQLGKYTSFSG